MSSEVQPADLQTFDARAFRNALGSFPTGVAVITSLDADGQPIGLTCNSFSSVSLDPPLVSWSLRNASKSLDAFAGAGVFAINILADDQTHLSARFASGKIADKFEGVACRTGYRGLPLIEECVASFECETFAAHEAGDHTLFLGKVIRFEQGRHDPSLVFYKGAYMMLTASLSELAEQGKVDPHNLDQARRLVNCMLLRLASTNGTDAEFDAIEAAIADIEQLNAPDDREKLATAGVEFFRLITKAAHNEVLLAVSESLSTILRHVLKSDTALRHRSELAPVRRQILAHLRQRDGAAAEQEMTRYFEIMRRGSTVANV